VLEADGAGLRRAGFTGQHQQLLDHRRPRGRCRGLGGHVIWRGGLVIAWPR
jgi:hypothetical protein